MTVNQKGFPCKRMLLSAEFICSFIHQVQIQMSIMDNLPRESLTTPHTRGGNKKKNSEYNNQ